MLDIAADQINELHPQLAIFAIIGDDFTRARWWAKSIDDHNVTRWMLSTRSTNFRDYHFAVDQLLVVPQATRQWCAQQLAHPNSHDPTLEKANRQFATIAREVEAVRKAVPLLSWDHSFIYYRLFKGSPYRYPPGNTPRISATDFREDPRAVADVQRIRMSGTPVILVYLPMMAELKAHKVIATPQAVVLMNSLESMLHERFYVVQQEYAGPLPTKIDLQPYDWHPNEQGLDFYAARVAHMVTRQMVKHSGGAQSY